ncbi:MAG: hypothetical protein L0154_12315 [Chloroflexi bacterium]|nr:hypothetical protein [Chloroflexota bacterium]
MNLENVSPKQLGELELRVTDLLDMMRKAKLQHEPVIAHLEQLREELGQARRERFDAANSEYRGY